MYQRLIGFSLVVCILAMIAAPAAMAAEQGTVVAASAWVGKGRLFATGEDDAKFVGVFVGVLYVETEDKKLDAMKLVCPGDVDINLEDGSQQGDGNCILTDKDDDTVYADWDCKGTSFLGCDGNFTLTGGSGKFKGITGQSVMKARTAFQELTINLDSGAVVEASAGLLALPEISYSIP